MSDSSYNDYNSNSTLGLNLHEFFKVLEIKGVECKVEVSHSADNKLIIAVTTRTTPGDLNIFHRAAARYLSQEDWSGLMTGQNDQKRLGKD